MSYSELPPSSPTLRRSWAYPIQLVLDGLIFLGLLAEATSLLFGYSSLTLEWNLALWAQWLGAAFLFGGLRVFGPVLVHELTCLARRRNTFLLRTGYALLLLVLI